MDNGAFCYQLSRGSITPAGEALQAGGCNRTPGKSVTEPPLSMCVAVKRFVDGPFVQYQAGLNHSGASSFP